jgi:hypothetical protein
MNEVDFGQRLRESLKKLDLDGSSLRTVPICEISDLQESFKISGRSGIITSDGTFSLQKPTVPFTNENASISLPTVTVMDSIAKPMPPRKKHNGGGQKPGLISVAGDALNPAFTEWMMSLPMDWTLPAGLVQTQEDVEEIQKWNESESNE